MPDQSNESKDTDKKDGRVEIELFDPWEQQFKFEPRSHLHGHTVEKNDDIESGTVR